MSAPLSAELRAKYQARPCRTPTNRANRACKPRVRSSKSALVAQLPRARAVTLPAFEPPLFVMRAGSVDAYQEG